MTVKACFYVKQITRQTGSDGADVVLTATTRGERGKEWAKYTPSGELTLRCMSEGATAFFQAVQDRATVPGQRPEVYLTIEIADDVDAAEDAPAA